MSLARFVHPSPGIGLRSKKNQWQSWDLIPLATGSLRQTSKTHNVLGVRCWDIHFGIVVTEKRTVVATYIFNANFHISKARYDVMTWEFQLISYPIQNKFISYFTNICISKHNLRWTLSLREFTQTPWQGCFDVSFIELLNKQWGHRWAETSKRSYVVNVTMIIVKKLYSFGNLIQHIFG